MLILFQSIFLLFVLFAIWGVVKRKQDSTLSTRGMWFWILFWLAGGIVVAFPQTATMLAAEFGIGRGADLIIYVSIALLFYLLFRLHIKIEGINRDVTKMVRREAIDKEIKKLGN